MCWNVLFLLTDLIKRLEEENKVNVYLCQEKLPKVKSNLRLDKDKQSNCLFLFSSKKDDHKSPPHGKRIIL